MWYEGEKVLGTSSGHLTIVTVLFSRFLVERLDDYFHLVQGLSSMIRASLGRSSRESARRVFFIRLTPSILCECMHIRLYLDQPGNRVLVWAATCTLAEDDVTAGGRVQVSSSFSLDKIELLSPDKSIIGNCSGPV